MGIRDNFLVLGAGRKQSRLLREAVQSSSLGVFSNWLDCPGLTSDLTLL